MFKVGDDVMHRETKSMYKVEKVFGDRIAVEGYGNDFPSFAFELTWQPQNGEMIEVLKSNDTEWAQRKFFSMNGNCPVCYFEGSTTNYKMWENGYRQIPTTHTITLDGKTAEISAESMEALKKLIADLD